MAVLEAAIQCARVCVTRDYWNDRVSPAMIEKSKYHCAGGFHRSTG